MNGEKMMTEKLDAGKKHLLRLVMKDGDADGWAKVSELLWKFVAAIPSDLIELRKEAHGGFCRLTAAGEAIVIYT
jgi:hypothetical protein